MERPISGRIGARVPRREVFLFLFFSETFGNPDWRRLEGAGRRREDDEERFSTERYQLGRPTGPSI